MQGHAGPDQSHHPAAQIARVEEEMFIHQEARKLEENERLLQNNLVTVEKELQLKQQAMEMHKKKANDSAQSAADLKLPLETQIC